MTDAPHRILGDWDVPLSRVSEAGTSFDRTASEAECAALAASLSVDGVANLRFQGSLEPAPHRPRDIELNGRLTAAIGQTCSVSLEPMTTHIDEALQVRITDELPETAQSSEDDELPVLEQEEVDVFESGRVPVGRIVYETLASLIDPYPRKDDADEPREWSTDGNGETTSDHPFAALSRLKPSAGDDS